LVHQYAEAYRQDAQAAFPRFRSVGQCAGSPSTE
jgi:hypothetical protein